MQRIFQITIECGKCEKDKDENEKFQPIHSVFRFEINIVKLETLSSQTEMPLLTIIFEDYVNLFMSNHLEMWVSPNEDPEPNQGNWNLRNILPLRSLLQKHNCHMTHYFLYDVQI